MQALDGGQTRVPPAGCGAASLFSCHVLHPDVEYSQCRVSALEVEGLRLTYPCCPASPGGAAPHTMHSWVQSLCVRVVASFDGAVVQTVGMLVGPHHVLTNAAALFSQLARRYARSIVVIAQGEETPVACGFCPRSWLACTGKVSVALLVLRGSLGARLGWCGLGSLARAPGAALCTLTTCGRATLVNTDVAVHDIGVDCLSLQPAACVAGEGLVWVRLPARPLAAALGACTCDAAGAPSSLLHAAALSAPMFAELVGVLRDTGVLARAPVDLTWVPPPPSDGPAPALEEVIARARGGSVQAQLRLVQWYQRGERVQPDSARAVVWLQAACSAGSLDTYLELVRMLAVADGRGGGACCSRVVASASMQATVERLRGDARAGRTGAQEELGMCLLRGAAAERAEGAFWLAAAAVAGSRLALDVLPRLEWETPGVPARLPAPHAPFHANSNSPAAG
eukprot:CAMPEP_0177673630 /NCGR_PEP_ID=MMETSP0447-20121125/26067_1 /TAXON_ID=0 /ORGANISM="Stygamoeba regulata, Strain BSH-02190019" /LENGTH=453 /DNA_ID=CAMNT_0019181557 /DNA_START=212 /DNA_END=1573 /DNA_ORIENTATION=+